MRKDGEVTEWRLRFVLIGNCHLQVSWSSTKGRQKVNNFLFEKSEVTELLRIVIMDFLALAYIPI